jgi:hypothetical protein
MRTMTNTNKYQEYDIITIIIVLVSCIITTLLNELRCLISQNSKPSIPTPGKHVGPSKTTKRTSNSKTKNQPRSRSTKPSSGTVDQKKVAGGSVKATPKKHTASSRRSKQSGSTCNSQTSTKSSTSLVLEIQQPVRTGNSASPMTTQECILQNDHTTAST